MDELVPKYDISKGPPKINPELISYLITVYPNELPSRQFKDIREADVKYGQQTVITHLATIFKNQLQPE